MHGDQQEGTLTLSWAEAHFCTTLGNFKGTCNMQTGVQQELQLCSYMQTCIQEEQQLCILTCRLVLHADLYPGGTAAVYTYMQTCVQ